MLTNHNAENLHLATQRKLLLATPSALCRGITESSILSMISCGRSLGYGATGLNFLSPTDLCNQPQSKFHFFCLLLLLGLQFVLNGVILYTFAFLLGNALPKFLKADALVNRNPSIGTEWICCLLIILNPVSAARRCTIIRLENHNQ